MELVEIQRIITECIDQIKSDQLVSLAHWLDEKLSKYRMSSLMTIPTQSILTPKVNHGQRFMCSCGRSFSTEITIRETTNVENSSPPQTPLLLSKHDLKHHQYIQTCSNKRVKASVNETVISTTALNVLNDRLNPSVNLSNWHQTNLKHYEDSPELLGAESTRAESDIELSSDDSRCLEEIDAVLSPDKGNASNFIYSSSLWSPSMSNCLNYSGNHQDDHRSHQHQHQHHQQHEQQRSLETLKPVSHEPLSPVPLLLQDEQSNKPFVAIHRQPMLIAITHPETCSTTGPTHFKCTQCHETFDSLLLAQEHVNNSLCISDTTGNVLDNSDSQLSPATSPLFDSLQENMEEALNTRPDSKAACPICNKMFSSVHTMIRHKTSIHDRQVRYGCNICGRYFFRKDKLTSHMVYHQDFDSYVCCICSSGFKSRMLMRQHLKRDHLMSNDDKQFNEILTRCQVKKSLDVQNNMSVAAYGAAVDRPLTIPSKRTINMIVEQSDLKPTTSN